MLSNNFLGQAGAMPAMSVSSHPMSASTYQQRDPASPTSPGGSVQYPSADTLINYTNSKNGAELTPPSSQTRGSNPLNVGDPIAMQLLVQTALEDAKTFQILPWEELEDLKREAMMLNTRMEQVRRKLAIEMKMRDAARSLNRLVVSPTPFSKSISKKSPERKRDTIDRAEAELAQCNQKCEYLSRELYDLERKSQQAEIRILRHTAGVLQMTHVSNKQNFSGYHAIDRPASPMSLDAETVYGFDEEHDVLYGRPEHLDGILEELRADKPIFRTAVRKNKSSDTSSQVLSSVNIKLEELNVQIGELLQGSGSGQATILAQSPPPDAPKDMDVENAVDRQLELLSQGLQDIAHQYLYAQQNHHELVSQHRDLQSTVQNHGQLAAELAALQAQYSSTHTELQSAVQESMSTRAQLEKSESRIMTQIRAFNANLSDLLESSSHDEMPPVPAEEEGTDAQIYYMQQRANNVKSLLENLLDAQDAQRNASIASRTRSEEYEAVLQGLWQIVLADEEDHRQWHKEIQQHPDADRSLQARDEADSSPADDTFSLQIFSQRLQRLLAASHTLRASHSDALKTLSRHREQLSRSVDPSTDPAYNQMRLDLERMEKLLLTAEEVSQEQEQQISDRGTQLQNLHAEHNAALEQLHSSHQIMIADLHTRHKDLQSRHEEANSQLGAASRDLQAAQEAHKTAENSHAETAASLQKSRDAGEVSESEIVRLTTELTIAKADLDAAHGSRQQRALELQTEATAALEASQQKLSESQSISSALEADLLTLRTEHETTKTTASTSAKRVQELTNELEATIAEYEELTRASVEAEKEREAAEGLVDKLRMDIDDLEAKMADERLDAVGPARTPGLEGGAGIVGMGTTVLRTEFKKMMREMRGEHLKNLRGEQEERRRLESQLRQMRRGRAQHSPQLSVNTQTTML